ncbi:DUF6495 family protein [Flavobacteriaceae bacterium S356]|uniref:DUF6495 family protein n=1 Tax=Asprobacillus argus TaxID=3076534 RepID=A0ABU3LE83_9FLAO|nr:DUF6495 family protein [Flavobacteriaceae bacterium S356]
MKYRQLTKEQLESLHHEFAQFLGTQKIDVQEWGEIKKNKPELAEEELNLFSDMVWEDVLNKVNYLEHFSKNSINLFKCDEHVIQRIVITIHNDIDLFSEDGYKWLLQNPKDDAIEYLTGTKKYALERNHELFDLIEKGSSISKGELYEYFNQLTS